MELSVREKKPMPRNDAFPETDCRHNSPSVDKEPFTARMRFHQSWYRHHVLGLEPGPHPSSGGVLYGNMLTREDGDKGCNFLSDGIFAHAMERFPITRRGSVANRLYCNMLGSQTMCFNLFGPLKSDHSMSLASRLLSRLPGAPDEATVTGVLFEYAPVKTRHLNDATSFDAFITYTRPSGGKGFIGIETKLTEPFSKTKKYDFSPRYATWLERHRAGWWWKPGSESNFTDRRYNQLWRNHLLAFSMLNQEVAEYSEGFCAVANPSRDVQCGRAITAYRQNLLPSGEETLLEWPLETVCDAWEPVLTDDSQRQWLSAFRTRYIDLEASEPAWAEFAKAKRLRLG